MKNLLIVLLMIVGIVAFYDAVKTGWERDNIRRELEAEYNHCVYVEKNGIDWCHACIYGNSGC